MSMKYLDITGVGIEFDTNGSKFRALQNVNLKLDKGEFVSLIGHSGCGKSTVLNIVAGLYQATEGGVVLDQTIFYPTSGGQPGDSGVLVWDGGRMEIATAIKGEGEAIVLIPAEPLALEEEVMALQLSVLIPP